MVNDFVIDPMHLIYVNTMKRLFQFLTGNMTVSQSLISIPNFKSVGKRFAKVRFPVDFHRQPRDFDHLSHYKASEMRMLLLYGYEIFTQGYYPEKLQDLVRFLAAATRIISDPALVKKTALIDVARILFDRFIQGWQKKYKGCFKHV